MILIKDLSYHKYIKTPKFSHTQFFVNVSVNCIEGIATTKVSGKMTTEEGNVQKGFTDMESNSTKGTFILLEKY